MDVLALIAFVVLHQMLYALKCRAQVTATIMPQEDYSVPVDPDRLIHFDCSSTRMILQWMVNGVFAGDAEIVQNNNVTTTATVMNYKGTFTSSLFIPASIENDNTSIQCRTADLESSPAVIAYSKLVFLHIQGLLDPPPNLTLTEAGDQLTRILTWGAPETLDLTDIDPDIQFYQVCYNLSDDLTCINVSSSERREFRFPNVCVPLIFTVTAFNVVGEGRSSTVVHSGSGYGEQRGLIHFVVNTHMNALIQISNF